MSLGTHDPKEDARIQAILVSRLGGKRRAADTGAAVRFSVAEDGQASIEAPEGVTQAEAEAALVRGLVRYFIEN